jgi:hypothetical protein
MMATIATEDRRGDWEDIANLVFGFALVLSPWLFKYYYLDIPALNAWFAGFAIMVIAFGAILEYARWEEYLNMVVGLWLVVSPFLLGYADMNAMTVIHVAVGALVAVLAGYEMYHKLRELTDTRKTA